MDLGPFTGQCDTDSLSLLENDSERWKKRLQNPPGWLVVDDGDDPSLRSITGQEEALLGEMESSWFLSEAMVSHWMGALSEQQGRRHLISHSQKP